MDEIILKILPAKMGEEITNKFKEKNLNVEEANKRLGELVEEGYVEIKEDTFQLTEQGKSYLKRIKEVREEEVDWLEKVDKALDQFMVGEHNQRKLLFLLACTTWLEEPQAVTITGSSSSGKDHLVTSVLKLFPEEFTLPYSRITDKVLDYLESIDVKNKIFYIEEIGGSKGALPVLRTWVSRKELRLLANVKDRWGKTIPKEFRVKGVPSIITTTADFEFDQQFKTRIWALAIDESAELTYDIMKFHAQKKAYPESYNYELVEEIKTWLKFRPKDIKILIPYAEELVGLLPKEFIRSRRDFKKLLTLIEVIAWVRYQIEPKIKINNTIYYLATLRDLQDALELFGSVLKETLLGLTSKQLETYEKSLKYQEMKGMEEEFTLSDLAKALGMHRNTLRSRLESLVQAGLVEQDIDSRPYHYRVITSFAEMPKIAESINSFVNEGFTRLKPYFLRMLTMTTSVYIYTSKWEKLDNSNIDSFISYYLRQCRQINKEISKNEELSQIDKKNKGISLTNLSSSSFGISSFSRIEPITGKCSYCGEEKELKWKTKEGYYCCQECYVEEIKKV